MRLLSILVATLSLLNIARAGVRHTYQAIFVYLAYRLEYDIEKDHPENRIIGVRCLHALEIDDKRPDERPKYRCVALDKNGKVDEKGEAQYEHCTLKWSVYWKITLLPALMCNRRERDPACRRAARRETDPCTTLCNASVKGCIIHRDGNKNAKIRWKYGLIHHGWHKIE